MARGDVNELFKAWDDTGGCCYCNGIFLSCPCPEEDDWDEYLEETALPTGWTMKTPEELDEEGTIWMIYMKYGQAMKMNKL